MKIRVNFGLFLFWVTAFLGQKNKTVKHFYTKKWDPKFGENDDVAPRSRNLISNKLL